MSGDLGIWAAFVFLLGHLEHVTSKTPLQGDESGDKEREGEEEGQGDGDGGAWWIFLRPTMGN